MRISIIVPFLNEERALPGTVDRLVAEAAGHGDTEIIVVDGGSRDASRAVLARYPGLQLTAARRGRASQMNAGARIATGGVLLFVHADTLLPPGALTAVAAVASQRGFVFGGFRHAFDGTDWRLRLVSALHNYRCARARTFYGDQALFVARAWFDAAGGYPDVQAEDIALSQRLRAIGNPALIPLAVTTSARKFVQAGVWTSLLRVLAILMALRFGRKPPQAFFADIR